MGVAEYAGNRQVGQQTSVETESIELAAQLMRQALSLLDGTGALPRRSAEPAGVVEDDRLIRLPEVLRLTGMCRSALYNQMALGQFPRSIKIGPRATSWSVKEVRVWIAQRVG
jgi:prophage regulatory protein